MVWGRIYELRGVETKSFRMPARDKFFWLHEVLWEFNWRSSEGHTWALGLRGLRHWLKTWLRRTSNGITTRRFARDQLVDVRANVYEVLSFAGKQFRSSSMHGPCKIEYWLCSGSALGVCWLSLDCVLAVSWLSLGCVLLCLAKPVLVNEQPYVVSLCYSSFVFLIKLCVFRQFWGSIGLFGSFISEW